MKNKLYNKNQHKYKNNNHNLYKIRNKLIKIINKCQLVKMHNKFKNCKYRILY